MIFDYSKILKALITTAFKVVAYDDILDWRDYGMESIINRTLNNKNLGGGSIILMNNGAKYTPQALEGIITGLQEKGYDLVPISQLIYTGEYKIVHTVRQFQK
jgi:peptidoglycan-N-acetylglucosamine deacetylase